MALAFVCRNVRPSARNRARCMVERFARFICSPTLNCNNFSFWHVWNSLRAVLVSWKIRARSSLGRRVSTCRVTRSFQRHITPHLRLVTEDEISHSKGGGTEYLMLRCVYRALHRRRPAPAHVRILPRMSNRPWTENFCIPIVFVRTLELKENFADAH